jgi:UDP-glucose 4-epimerase|tara:strand:+ start:400 stop:1413 length:1014 start_codon:yes stop_codon:yes gene_type:complete
MGKKMRILITGVAGLLGSRLADYLIENTEHELFGIDDLSGGYIDNIPKEVKFYKFDLSEDGKVEKVFDTIKPDIVYHFAAYAAEGLSPFMRTYNYKNNLVSTAKVINGCINHNVKRLVFTSSMAVYGNGWNGKRPFDESDLPSPIDPYGIAKMACEKDIQVAGEQHGLDWCIIRPHNVYGEKQNIWDKYRNVLGIWMYQYMNDEPMTIFGDGEQTRAFSYIGDCLEPLYKSGVDERASKQIINLGGTTFYSINEANETLRRVIEDGEKVHKEKRHEVKDAYPTWDKSIELLDFEDKTSLEEGLSKMWEWAQTQPNRQRKFWEVYEVEKGIYEFWKSE